MAMIVSDIRAWLDQFTNDTLIGISEDDEMTLRPADERYHDAYLEIGMALSSEYLERTRPPYVIPTPEIMEAQREAAFEDFDRTYPFAMKTATDNLRAQLAAAGIDMEEEYEKNPKPINLIRFLFPKKETP